MLGINRYRYKKRAIEFCFCKMGPPTSSDKGAGSVRLLTLVGKSLTLSAYPHYRATSTALGRWVVMHSNSSLTHSSSHTCNNWNSPMLFPNCFLVCAYWKAVSIAACIRPTGPAASTSRSRSSPDINTYTPLFTSPRMFFAGTC